MSLLTRMYEYQFGGSLPLNSPTYVVRQADADLFRGVLSGQFCYVLNSRQMGKSSLRVRTIQLLQSRGIVCGVVDLTSIFSRNITAEEWYAAFAYSILSSFNLVDRINLLKWWRDRLAFSPVQRLRLLLEEVVLSHIPHNVVIFVDEIDSILGLQFPVDDFFDLICSCYRRRDENPEYQRLTWVLLGVAAPSELISHPQSSPFDIGREIQLTGFHLQDCLTLAEGLVMKARSPNTVLRQILAWTGGKPFLTQKLCHLVANCAEFIPIGHEEQAIAQLVRSRILNNWEVQDEPEHLRSIRDRLLKSRNHRKILELYWQILSQGEIPADDSLLQTELRLSGLVVKSPFGNSSARPILQVYNKVYAFVFNKEWLKRTLGYVPAPSLDFWIDRNISDEQRLYDHLLYWVKKEDPTLVIQRVHKLFIQIIGYPDIEISAALRRLTIEINEQSQFNKILNRCFYTLINHWQMRLSCQSAIVGLIAMFDRAKKEDKFYPSSMPSYAVDLKHIVRDFCDSPEYKTIEQLFVEPIIHATVKEFQESADYEFLRILIDKNKHAPTPPCPLIIPPLKTQVYRYPYLYQYSLIQSNSTRDHQLLLQDIQAERQWDFELSLSQYATYLIKRVSGIPSYQPVANPTLLSDDELYSAIQQFTGKVEGDFTYKELARNFLQDTENVQSYEEFKEHIYDYLISAIDPDFGYHHFYFNLRRKLKSLFPERDRQDFNSILLAKTCQDLLKFLIESPHHPNHYIFVNLIANLGELKTSALLLKIVLLSGQTQSNLGHQLFQWFNYYESQPLDRIQWFVNFLENINVALVINNETLDFDFLQTYLNHNSVSSSHSRVLH